MGACYDLIVCLPNAHSQNSYVSLSLPATLNTTLYADMVPNDVNEVGTMILTSTKSTHLVSLEILIRTEALHTEEETCEVPGRKWMS